ncbi:pyruvate dehydrogenase (acetyl-transferring) E1 component subunit alpha [Tumebacillus algifaecis]|uniref:Pyruvate dehydrogenase E1 component subunit alpha n=1 Tax=Tumebacillus algifaecis TaxID=1214604 RepID=A0A223D5C6_9BACL|nr:pyruvate dehydrogenase (acetyl-transferring) E1 component subunit alpha [Tumebacillus algifaecis]ASS76690.1 pyruvate dehydrogenase (acetyl-transferring) E1 component subunit alpha [Tumebacillus algifaecis]
MMNRIDQEQADANTVSTDQLIDMYRWMITVRHFDRRAVHLQRSGRIGTYAPLEGQEAAQVGCGFALEKRDWLFPTYREHGVSMVHGLPMATIFLYWNGRPEGCISPRGVNIFPIAVPIATQLPHAVGAAWASKLRGEDTVTVGFLGDGATSEGDFHEAMNFAGVFKLPVLFFCQNNGYAISVPLAKQTATETIAEKAAAYGVEGIRVDGNDVLAVYEAVKWAADKARSGGGPTLIEAVTYRFGSHTTADDHTRYRASDEVEAWREKDGIERLRRTLVERGVWSDELESDAWERADRTVQRAIDEMLSAPPVDHNRLFDYAYAKLPQQLQDQREEMRTLYGDGGGK